MKSRIASARRLMAGVAVLGIALTGVVIPAPPAGAFPPSKLLALGGNSHASITESVITQLDREFFEVSTTTKSMRKAIEEIVEANEFVDDDQFFSEKHFDGENFAAGQTRLIALRRLTIDQLRQGRGKIARLDLGQALHTIQDFYSHSNWVELGNTAPNQALGRPGQTLGPVAGPTEPACDGSTLTTSKLTSGYYGGEDRRPRIAGKCRHGGPFDKSPGGPAGINKDSRLKLLSPHNPFHQAAAQLATDATAQFIRDIAAQITARQLRLLLGAGPTLGFSIDTTGSMEPIIEGVKNQAIGIVDARLGTDEEPTQYVLAPFNDPSVGPVLATDDPTTFKRALSTLPAVGGGDCAEPAMSGIGQALPVMDKGGDLFVFTDAGPKDAALASAVLDLAEIREITIYPMVFGSCSPIDPAFFRLAHDTVGQVFDLSSADAGAITQLADFLVRANTVDLLAVVVELDGSPRSFTVPVDSTMTSLTASVSGSDQVQISRPDGSLVGPGDPGVDLVTLSPESAPALIARVNDPSPGEWTVRVEGTGQVSLGVSGESPLDLATFGFVQEDQVHGHEGLVPIPGLPVSGRTVTAHAVLTDGYQTAEFTLRGTDGAELAPLDLAVAQGNDFTGELTPPEPPFRAYVTGQDTSGTPYQRLLPTTIRAQPLQVTAPDPAGLRAGEPTTYPFEVHNFGERDSFRVSVLDDRGFQLSATPESIDLDTDETGTVEVRVEPPAEASAYSSDRVVVDVSSTTRPGVHNFAALADSLVAEVAKPPPPGGGGGELPNTGLLTGLLAGAGGAVLALGVLLTALGRRRRAA